MDTNVLDEHNASRASSLKKEEVCSMRFFVDIREAPGSITAVA